MNRTLVSPRFGFLAVVLLFACESSSLAVEKGALWLVYVKYNSLQKSGVVVHGELYQFGLSRESLDSLPGTAPERGSSRLITNRPIAIVEVLRVLSSERDLQARNQELVLLDPNTSTYLQPGSLYVLRTYSSGDDQYPFEMRSCSALPLTRVGSLIGADLGSIEGLFGEFCPAG